MENKKDDETMENNAENDIANTEAPMSKTTTISTIAVQSGRTRIVIALLHCGDWLQLKILEVTPELTSLGNTLNEALELQKAHDEVLRQLQNKQSPVEELLRQADQLISTQKPRAEVYAAMAESLGRAWKDVNFHLELRKHILDLNVQYHTRAQEFFDKITTLEASCTDTLIPIEIDAVKNFLTNIHDQRRAVLEALVGALHSGNALIAKLKELGAKGTLDSRPDRIRTSVEKAIAQVQGWMDELHVRRTVLETTFTRRKDQLEQCLALAVLAADMRELEETVCERRELLVNTDQLGDSSSSAELLQFEHKKLLPEAKLLQEKALKITKATEKLLASGCFAGEEATKQAYTVLSTTSDYLADLQQRDALLDRVIAFFRLAQTTLTKLDQLEDQLMKSELPKTSPQLAQLHAQTSKTIETITEEPLAEGHAILEMVGRGRTGTEGVKRMVEELENRKIQLDGLCVAHKEENRRINEVLNTFLAKQSTICSWLVDIAEAFLQSHRDMGRDLPTAKDFLNLHNQLLTDLQTKGNEINVLLLTLPPILEYLDDDQRQEVDTLVGNLHDRWRNIKDILEKRLDLANIYVKFHEEANIVNSEMDRLEDILERGSGNLPEETLKKIEEDWESLIPLYQSAKNTGLTFKQISKVSEPYLDTELACVCVDSVLEALKNRQLVVTRSWQSFQTELEEKRELLIKWEENMVESTRTINWVTKLNSQLYPVITTNATYPKDVSDHVQKKLETVLPEIKRAQCEVEQRIKTTETLMAKSPPMDEKSLNVKNKLSEMNHRLIQITTDYRMLLEKLVTYFNNLNDVDKTVSNVNTKFSRTLPKNLVELDIIIKEHEASTEHLIETFKSLQNECNQLVERINKQEPPGAAEQDIAKLQHTVRLRRDNWERDWSKIRDDLEAHKQLCQFDSDLQQINSTLNDLSRQLAAVKGQYGESLSTANNISSNFVQFEKTIEELEKRIEAFVRKGEQMLDEQHAHSPHINHHIRDLQDRWNKFKQQVRETRRLIDLSIKYFKLVEEADKWFREGSRLLMNITKKATTVKKPEEAQLLLNEIEMFLKPGESKQDDRIRQISQLSAELFGHDKSPQFNDVVVQNTDMLESFAAISQELEELAKNLRLVDEQREKARREQEEADAKLEAAKAEAAAAKAAAQAAEEARRAAETAAKLMRESTITHHVEIVELPDVREIPVVDEKPVEKTIEIVEIEQQPKMEAPKFVSPLSDAVIEEGSKFTFVCKVTGIPLPIVTWYKDGISIQNFPDYDTSFDQGLCTLTIDETFADDSAKYTCKATNAAGSAETSGALLVKETEPEEQLLPPSFVKYLQPTSVKEGQPFQFECKVEGNPLPTVQWFKNVDCIDNSPDYVITYNNGEAILKFDKVYLVDKAEYCCKATNDLGVAQCSATLNVIPMEPTESPAFTMPLSNVMARAGQKIKLECEVSGLPPPTLTWSHNGKTVRETREIKLLRDGKKATLLVNEAFPKDAGTYVVTASNIAGEATSGCTVSVKGRLPIETSDSELASDMEPIKPSIQLHLQNVAIIEGKEARLDCVIVGQPEPEVIWYHDDLPVKESPEFQLKFQGDHCTLIIPVAVPEDAGEYKVIARNSAGEASSKCILTINPAETEEDVKPEEEKPAGIPPKFEKLLSDILVSEGDKVILEAIVIGEPKPEIKWLLNNRLIEASEHVQLTHDNSGNLKLEIEKVLPEDKGVYTVKASNPSGEVKCFAQLIVKSSKPAEVKIHEEAKSAPVFKESFTDREIYQNTSTKFECIVTGRPTPKVRWYFNDEPVSGKNFLVSTSGDRQVLTIPDAALENAGKITCLAENDVGKAVLNANLKVKSVNNITQQDGQFELMPYSTDLQQHTESSYSLKREVFMQSSTSQSSKIISSTGAAEPQINEHKITSETAQSFKQVDQKPPQIQESQKFEEYHQIGKQPVIHEKSSTFVSSGGTQDTRSVQTQQIQHTVIHKPVIKARPPKFITPVIGKIIDQGVDVVLEGILDGFPTPEVTWSKNGVPITSGEGIKITFDMNCARIEIKNANTNDAGQYTCTATNEAGKAVCTSDLVIKKTIFPPVFGHRLQAQVIKKGDRVIMNVEVTGTPEPTVTWHKDGIPIDQILRSGYRLLTQGNSHTLIIEKAELSHTGKYMVRAVNSGGEAQSIADMAVFEPTPDTMVEVVKTVVFEDVRKHETLTSATDKSTKTVSSTEEAASSESLKKPAEPPKPTIPIQIQPPVSKPFELPKQIETKKEVEIIKSEKPLSSESTIKSTESQFSSSKTEFSSFVEKSVKQESQTMKFEATTQLPLLEPLTLSKVEPEKKEEVPFVLKRETDYEIVYEPDDTKVEEKVEEAGIETSSITKRQSLDFFVKKMKEADETPKPKEIPKVTPIKQELYTKFEDISKAEKIEILKPETKIEVAKVELPRAEVPTFEIPKPEIPKPEPALVQLPIKPQQFESPVITPYKPELPKPKVEIPTTHFEHSFKSEVTQETVSPSTPTKFEPLPRYSMKSTSYKQYSSLSSSSQQKYEEITLTPEPPAEICYESHKSEEVSEKAKRLQDSYKEIASAEIPTGVAKTIPTAAAPKQAFIQETSSKSEFYKTETGGAIYRPSAEIPVRPVSPRPSAEALEMEKLWASQKVIEERPVSSYSYEKQTTTTTSTEPAMDAISMEKMWAHKHSESTLQKSWPPPQPEPAKSAPTWSTQSTLEKKWAPTTDSIEKESKTIVQESSQSAFERKWIPTSSQKFVQEIKTEPLSVPHYIAQVTHEHKVNEQELIVRSAFAEHKESRQTEVIEEKAAKASEIIKSWPPKPLEPEIPYKPSPTIESLPVRPVSVQDITDEVYLEPGPPPEIGFAKAPVERRQSYVEYVEHEIEKNLEKVPSRVLPGAVRTVPPPPLPPKKELPQAPPLPARVKAFEPPKKMVEIVSKPFERFPDLEPFPFKPDPMKPKPARCGPPPTPSKFIKGRFTDSDYESDVDAVRIPVKWRPYASDNEEPTYRRVQAPKGKVVQRSRSIDKDAVPPSQFERPPQFDGPPRPIIDFDCSTQIRKEAQQVRKQTKHYTKHVQYDSKKEEKKDISPPSIKPGSPPVFVQAEPKPKPPSPKMKQTVVVDGYMADTDEPFTLRHKKTVKSEHRHEERTEHKQFYQSSQSSTESTIHKTTIPAKTSPPKFSQHKRHVQSTTSAKKELVSTPIITSISSTEKIIDHGTIQQTLEPFPYQPEVARPKRTRAPPPPSPSKFVKGDFRESDYESEYEGRIPPVWRPSSADPEPTYRSVRPDLTPTGRTSQASERAPTPPSKFDVVPQVSSMRPKFEPIEKPKKVVRMEEIVKPIAKPALYKSPQYTAPRHEVTEIIVAAPAAPEKMLQPGTPPEIGYAPGPQKTQYYKSTTSTPYHNAVQTETSNVMHFNEATEHSRRTVSLQQTTKVIKFGDQTKETFQSKTDTERQRYKGPPPLKPSKFVPGEFRDSDHESELESLRIKPKWAPSGSDTEDFHYRKVRPPSATRSPAVTTTSDRIYTPIEFDTRPPEMPTKISTESSHVSEISKRFGETKSSQIVKSSDFALHPGSPPEYGYVPEKVTKSTATKIASDHMDSMTHTFKSKAQKFVNDIVDDVNKKNVQKPILKPKDDADAQVYREETRAAQYGTKHVDPDTGLIYFKYDFGYEFGIVLPGESKAGEIPVPKKTVIEPPKRFTDIEMPVYHESSTKPTTNSNHQPQFRPKKFTSATKNVKWEPTSESEMSEYEGESKRKLPGTGARWEQSSCSPVSISPSLPSTSPAFNNYPGSAHLKGTETPPSCPSTPGSIPAQQGLNKRAPIFITPLRDIAVVNGQTARFECIVQSEPPPSILWSKNGRIIENSTDNQIFYRNGVCRLTIPRAFPEDAGTYTCTATNQIGAVGTIATLQVPGVPSHMYGTYRQMSIGNRNASPDFIRYERPSSPPTFTHHVGKSNGLRYHLEQI